MTNPPVLEPCPFCGGRPFVLEMTTAGAPVFLGNCAECDAMGPPCNAEAEAIETWNRRAGAERYAALGRACESHGLGWYAPNGEMRFQPPAEAIADHAVQSYIAVLKVTP